MIQERFLDVFLNYPVLVLLRLIVNEIVNLSHVFEYLNAFSLIHGSRLDQPHVLSAMFKWYTFTSGPSSLQFSESVHEHVYCVVFNVPRDYESGRCGVKNCVACFLCHNVFFIVRLERSD